MPLSILNNIPSLAAENQLNVTNAAMQKTLAQLSSGSRINSGADDAAGLAIANGLQANVTALTQSAANANDGIGQLQLADGALAQVTSLLNRAVTLATEAANGGLGTSQTNALQAEYANILSEITQIGESTTYNGQQVFRTASGTDLNEWVGNAGNSDTPITAETALTASAVVQFTAGGKTFTFNVPSSGGTVGDLMSAINNPATDPAGLQAYIANNNLVVVDPSGNNTLQTQASDLTTINNDLNNLVTQVQSLSDPLGALSAMSAISSDAGIVTTTAQPSAAAGNYTIVVNTLASAGTVYTAALPNGATSILPDGASAGDLKLQVGGSSGATYDIPITPGSNDTLTTLAGYINQQSTANNWGVTAAVLNDATGSRLAIYSTATGTSGALAITSNSTSLTFEPPVGGSNATLTVDGIPFSSTSNTITGAIPGVTLNLASAASGTPVTVSVGLDAAGITNALNGFVAAYNQVITDLNQQFAVNSSTGQQGPLGSDSSLQLLQSSLLSDVNYSITGNGGIVNLASLGVSMNDDGTLNVDSSQLNSAVSSNAAAVQNFFQGSSLNGFANNFNTNLAQLTDPVTGLLTADLQQNHAEQTDLTNQISAFQQQLATQKQQLIQEYSQLNASLELYPFLLQSVTEQLDLLNGTTSSTGTTTPTAGSFGSSSSSTSGTLGG